MDFRRSLLQWLLKTKLKIYFKKYSLFLRETKRAFGEDGGGGGRG
jgi:hypothetical protein